MLDAAVLAAVAVVFGGVAAVTARDGRIVVLRLMTAAVTASLVASPLPGSLAVTARILGRGRIGHDRKRRLGDRSAG